MLRGVRDVCQGEIESQKNDEEEEMEEGWGAGAREHDFEEGEEGV